MSNYKEQETRNERHKQDQSAQRVTDGIYILSKLKRGIIMHYLLELITDRVHANGEGVGNEAYSLAIIQLMKEHEDEQ